MAVFGWFVRRERLCCRVLAHISRDKSKECISLWKGKFRVESQWWKEEIWESKQPVGASLWAQKTEQLHHVCQREQPLWLGNEPATPDRDFGWKHVIPMEEVNLKKNENAKNE